MGTSTALRILLGLFLAVVVFHLLVIAGVIPYDIVWAGKLKTASDMYVFESASIAINLLIIALLVLRQRHNNKGISARWLTIVLYLLVVLFALNTLGNLTAATQLERWLFTPLTVVSAILLWVVARNPALQKQG